MKGNANKERKTPACLCYIDNIKINDAIPGKKKWKNNHEMRIQFITGLYLYLQF